MSKKLEFFLILSLVFSPFIYASDPNKGLQVLLDLRREKLIKDIEQSLREFRQFELESGIKQAEKQEKPASLDDVFNCWGPHPPQSDSE